MNPNVLGAIFRRNFISYFSTPTGYLFICVFACVCAIAAFWPNEFFVNNLANLDQLNALLPWILLIFVPTITMSVWSDERRQGTDELLLTLPAADLDVVLGKYLAAVGIYSTALLFTLMSLLLVMEIWLGSPDITLFLGNFFGYWLVGAAMLSIGMVASFLTSSLTVGFILGVLFNLPLVLLRYADTVVDTSAVPINRWSISEQFRDFGQGVLSLSSIVYFGMLVVVMLYLSMVLIGRRHWSGGRDGHSMLGHFVVRAIALAAIALGLNVLLRHADARVDVSMGQISKLSPATRELIAGLDPKHPINIDAYVSPQVPEQLVQHRLDLINTLNELARAGDKNINLTIHDTQPLSDDADRAEKQFGIKPQKLPTQSRGAYKVDDVFMGVAFTSGLEKLVLPYIDNNIPIEYEMVRSIAAVSKQERKRVGVLLTDVELFGGFNMQTFEPRPQAAIITELEKQYTVDRVDASKPITEHYDVLLALQPSSLSQPQMDNFIAAVKAGQHTLILDDPAPVMWGQTVPGMTQPKMPNRNQMQQGPPPPKGDIAPLWQFLGVDWAGKNAPGRLGSDKLDAGIIAQNYNPYPKIDQVVQHTNEWVFVSEAMPDNNKDHFNQSQKITSHLQEMLFFYAGGLEPRNATNMRFTPLVTTGTATGILPSSEAYAINFDPPLVSAKEKATGKAYVLAARIQGAIEAAKDPTAKDPMAKEGDDKSKPADDKAEKSKDEKSKDEEKLKKPAKEVDVVLVSDIDIVSDPFFQIRAHADEVINWNLDNVTFVLNALDDLAGDERFIEIRKRKAEHPRLTRIEHATQAAREQTDAEIKKANDVNEEEINKIKEQNDSDIKAIEDRLKKAQSEGTLSFNQRAAAAQEAQEKTLQLAKKFERETNDRKTETQNMLNRLARQRQAEVERSERAAKLWAFLLPPILPLLLGFVVFFGRRAREQEGVSKARLR